MQRLLLTWENTGASSSSTGNTFIDESTYFADETDVVNKKFKFECGAITAERELAIPNASFTVVGHDTNQTLTNKTMTNDANTFTNSSATFFSAAWTTPISSKDFTFWAFRWGQIVTLVFPLKAGTTNGSAIFTRAGIIDAPYRPIQQMEYPCRIQNGTFGTGLVIISPAGDVSFYADTAGNAWPAGPVAFRIGNFSLSYSTVTGP